MAREKLSLAEIQAALAPPAGRLVAEIVPVQINLRQASRAHYDVSRSEHLRSRSSGAPVSSRQGSVPACRRGGAVGA